MIPPPSKRARRPRPSAPPGSRDGAKSGARGKGRASGRVDGLLILLRAAAASGGSTTFCDGVRNVDVRFAVKIAASEAPGESPRDAASATRARIACHAPPRLIPLAECILAAVRAAAGGDVTERALREAVGSSDAGRALRALLAAGLVFRAGGGGRGDPYQYSAAGGAAAGGGQACGAGSRVGALLAALKAATTAAEV